MQCRMVILCPVAGQPVNLIFKGQAVQEFQEHSGYTVHIGNGVGIPKHSWQPTWTASLLKMGPIVCPETSVQNYCSMLHNIPE